MNRRFHATDRRNRVSAWSKMRVVLQRTLQRPSFWQLQLMGWSGLYVLTLAAILPDLKKPGTFHEYTVFVGFLFLASCLMRSVCRSLLQRSLPWLALEVRAFAWSLAVGAVAALAADALSPGFIGRTADERMSRLSDGALPHYGVELAAWLGDSVQYAVVLFLWCSLYFSIKQGRQAADDRERMLRAESEAREARLAALRYQLNPHFLFNSLNAVSTLILDGNARAATRMLAQIAELLRNTLNHEIVPEVPLSQEIAFTERYLAIEQTRFGERLRVQVVIPPDTLDALVPIMLLQPLVENAVRHGVAPLIEGATIEIQSTRHDGHLRIVVRNSGPSAAVFGARRHHTANGIGLTNTVERLATMYGADHTFALDWPNDGGCTVTIQLPFRRGDQRPEELACVH